MAYIAKRPPWFGIIQEAIEQNWQHHAPCRQISVTSAFDDETCEWLIVASPIFQEVYGGEDDGKKVWTAFVFEASDFLFVTLFSVPGLAIEKVTASSYSAESSSIPMLVMTGKFHGERISLQILLEPIPGSPPQETIDTVRNIIRGMGDLP